MTVHRFDFVQDDVEWDDTLDDFGVEGRMKLEAHDGSPTHTFYYDYCPVSSTLPWA